jgi:hypothetical protein
MLVKATANENLDLAITNFAVAVARGDLKVAEISAWFGRRIIRTQRARRG